MRCPYCGSKRLMVIDSRDVEAKNQTRRRRECDNCKKRFTTNENIIDVDVRVQSSDGTLSNFKTETLTKNISECTKHSNIKYKQVEKIAAEVEEIAKKSYSSPISTAQIKELTVQKLKALDSKVAIRYILLNSDSEPVFNIVKKIIENEFSEDEIELLFRMVEKKK